MKNYIYLLIKMWIFFIILTLVSCASQQKGQIKGVHVLKQGDTCQQLAIQYYNDINKCAYIKEENQDYSFDNIQPGDVIRIPLIEERKRKSEEYTQVNKNVTTAEHFFEKGKYQEAIKYFEIAETEVSNLRNFDQLLQIRDAIWNSKKALRAFRKGNVAYTQNQYQNAIFEFRKVVEINPKDQKASDLLSASLIKLGEYYFRCGYYQDAIVTLTSIPKKSVQFQKANLLIDKSKKAKSNIQKAENESTIKASIQAYEYVNAINPEDINVQRALLTLYFRNGDYQKAKKQCEPAYPNVEANEQLNGFLYTIIDWIPYVMKDAKTKKYYLTQSQKAIDAMSKGVDAYQKKEYQKAITEFQKVLRINPEDKKAKEFMGNSMQHGKEQFQPICEMGIQFFLNEEYEEAYNKLKEAYFYNQSDKRCNDYYYKSLGAYEAIENGKNYLKSLSFDKAIESFKSLKTIQPKDKKNESFLYQSYYQWALHLFDSGKYDQAKKTIKKAISYKENENKDSFIADCGIALDAQKKLQAFIDNNNTERAMEKAHFLRIINPKDPIACSLLYGSLYKEANELFEKGKYQEAKRKYIQTKAVSKDKRFFEEKINNCDIAYDATVNAIKFRSMNERNKAISQLSKVLEVNPKDSKAVEEISSLYLQSGKEYYETYNFEQALNNCQAAKKYLGNCTECDECIVKAQNAEKAKEALSVDKSTGNNSKTNNFFQYLKSFF